MSKRERRVFLAELDALLDTRLAIFKQHDHTKVISLLKNGYLRRHVDDFPGLPFRKFRELYSKRDKSILIDAVATPIIDMIKEFIMEVNFNSVNGPNKFEPAIAVNIHPYKLEPEEISNIRDMLSALTMGSVEIDIIDLPYEKLDNVALSSMDVAYFAVYDYVEYLNIHLKSESLKKKPCPSIALVIPQLIFSEPSRQLSYTLEKDFQVVEDMINPFIALNFMPVSDFCINIPHDTTAKLKED